MYWILRNTMSGNYLAGSVETGLSECAKPADATRFTRTCDIRRVLQAVEDDNIWEASLCVGNARNFVGGSL